MIFYTIVYVGFLLVWSFVRIGSFLSVKKNKEAAVFGTLIGVSSVVGSLLIFRVNLPSMVVPFKIIFEPIGTMLLMQ
ncbi:hypothetical protein PAECIP111891_05350 [Paenibacillus allorhizoplanae]|uniref:Uncharacterized protein n=1 Tax=Paenibacillus allorhizoplanae TaxID=2905648 RepID=A0ABM9CRI1_9BACL|nr:hypothetical protein [Paenibacillus allorhizoplanae]CAH1222468.1 hypothetical protein PAECIP111891_05350 [Paenibacillus allorhizoplanae]